MINIRLPDDVKRIMEKLEDAGFEAYAVGGCIRDYLLGRPPGDHDITTDARPDQIKALFSHTVDTGIEHGTVTVLLGGKPYEVTTYRVDGPYSDGRHPDAVSFTRSLEEDLLRRDFTINAMAYNEREGLKDLYGGVSDLENRLIRCVGDPKDRFREDALRILRALRFAAQLDFTLEEGTKKAIREMAPGLVRISAERIQTELKKLLLSDNPDYVRLLKEYGITDHILKWADPDKECLEALKASKADLGVRLGIMLSKNLSEAGEILRTLKMDNATIDKVKGILKYKDGFPEAEKKAIKRYISETGEELFLSVTDYKEAYFKAAGNKEGLRDLRQIKDIYEDIKENGECISIRDLMINGADIIALGAKEGPEIGDILKKLLLKVIEEPDLNSKETLLNAAKEYLKI